MTTNLLFLFLFVSIVTVVLLINNRSVAQSSYTYLALGDSYTIGEGVMLPDTFPYQTVQLLRKSGYNFNAPELIARTGWTAAELKEGMRNTYLQSSYDFVSILIGVNDQYRGLGPENYRLMLEEIVKQAISLTAEKKNRVFILSIPDWSTTPFAEGRDRQAIARHIEQFNEVAEEVAARHHIPYLYITPGTVEAGTNTRHLTADGLHYSRKELSLWAGMLAEGMMRVLS